MAGHMGNKNCTKFAVRVNMNILTLIKAVFN